MSIKREYDFPPSWAKDMYLLHHEEIESHWLKNIPGVKRIRFFMTFGQSYLTHVMLGKRWSFVQMLFILTAKKRAYQFLKALLPDPASLGPRTVGKTNISCIFTGVSKMVLKDYLHLQCLRPSELYAKVGSELYLCNRCSCHDWDKIYLGDGWYLEATEFITLRVGSRPIHGSFE